MITNASLMVKHDITLTHLHPPTATRSPLTIGRWQCAVGRVGTFEHIYLIVLDIIDARKKMFIRTQQVLDSEEHHDQREEGGKIVSSQNTRVVFLSKPFKV